MEFTGFGENHDFGHDGIDHIEICNIGISSALKVNWLPFKLLTSNFQSKRSILARGPPGQENPRYEPGMEMLTVGSCLEYLVRDWRWDMRIYQYIGVWRVETSDFVLVSLLSSPGKFRG